MKYTITPEDAQPIASCIERYYKRRKWKIHVEELLFADAPYRTTLLAKKPHEIVLFEAQKSPSLSTSLLDLTLWLAKNGHNCRFYIATYSDSKLKASLWRDLEQSGVGLIQIDQQSSVHTSIDAVNFARLLNPDPSHSYGSCALEVKKCFSKFNYYDRKDGLRDLCEVAERETKKLARTAHRKRLFKKDITETIIREKDWSGLIDTLASKNAFKRSVEPIISAALKKDLHVFREARNLVDHSVENKRAERQRQKVFPDRMLLGARVISDLMTVKGRLSRRLKKK